MPDQYRLKMIISQRFFTGLTNSAAAQGNTPQGGDISLNSLLHPFSPSNAILTNAIHIDTAAAAGTFPFGATYLSGFASGNNPNGYTLMGNLYENFFVEGSSIKMDAAFGAVSDNIMFGVVPITAQTAPGGVLGLGDNPSSVSQFTQNRYGKWKVASMGTPAKDRVVRNSMRIKKLLGESRSEKLLMTDPNYYSPYNADPASLCVWRIWAISANAKVDTAQSVTFEVTLTYYVRAFGSRAAQPN